MLNARIVWVSIHDGTQREEKPISVQVGSIWQPVIEVRTDDFTAIMPMKYQLVGTNVGILETRVGTNLYKNTYPDAERDKTHTKNIMEAVFGKDTKWHASSLFDASLRGMVIDEGRFMYATSNSTVKIQSDASRKRAEQFPSTWQANNYNFWQREEQPQADFLMTNVSGVGLSVYSADCVLALIYDRKHGSVAVCHSMWRQLAGKWEETIIYEVINSMERWYGTSPDDIEVLLFPAASLNTYEVSSEVAAEFDTSNSHTGEILVCEINGKPHLNLNGITRFRFMQAGVPEENIGIIPYTTDNVEFASLRNAPKCDGLPAEIPQGNLELALPNGSKLCAGNSQNVLLVRRN